MNELNRWMQDGVRCGVHVPQRDRAVEEPRQRREVASTGEAGRAGPRIVRYRDKTLGPHDPGQRVKQTFTPPTSDARAHPDQREDPARGPYGSGESGRYWTCDIEHDSADGRTHGLAYARVAIARLRSPHEGTVVGTLRPAEAHNAGARTPRSVMSALDAVQEADAPSTAVTRASTATRDPIAGQYLGGRRR
jgi:hypothetical protein